MSKVLLKQRLII